MRAPKTENKRFNVPAGLYILPEWIKSQKTFGWESRWFCFRWAWLATLQAGIVQEEAESGFFLRTAHHQPLENSSHHCLCTLFIIPTVNPEYFVHTKFSYADDLRPFVRMKFSYCRWPLRIMLTCSELFVGILLSYGSRHVRNIRK